MSTTTQRADLWASFIHAHAVITEAIEHRLRPAHGVGLPEFEVLMFLSDAPEEGKRMQELARTALLTRSGLTRLVDRLENAGLVRRTTCASDRRGTLTVITPDGRKLVNEAREEVFAAIDEHFTSHLTAEQRRVMHAGLRRILAGHGHEIPSACETLGSSG